MANYRILIVDDQPLVLTAIARFLEQRGYEVQTAPNGAEGLTTAETQKPDLIITDVKMPVMDGWTLVKTLRLRPDFALLPVIILTDQDSAESRMQGFRLGADDFVSKGTIVEELEVRIARALERTEAIKKALGLAEPAARSGRDSSQTSALESGIFQPASPGTLGSTPKPAVPERPLDLPPLAGAMGTGGPSAPDGATENGGTPGMTGTLDQIGLASILNLLSTGGKSGILNVVRADQGDYGQIFLREGSILRVRVEGDPELRHADAIAEIMRWGNAQFAFSLQDVTAQDEVHTPTEHLLMEASRLLDEGNG